MKLFRVLFKTVLLGWLFISSNHLSADQKKTIDFQGMQQKIMEISEADKNTVVANKSLQDSKSQEIEKTLPSIVPSANKNRNQLSPTLK